MTEPSEAAGAPPARKKRKKKRKKGVLGRSPTPPRPLLDAAGRERPMFVLAFPDHPELDRLVAAFERGDYATVRDDAPRLAASTERADVRVAAEELRRRIEPDPLMRLLLGMSVLLLAFLVIWTYFVRGP